ncbi:MAG: DUF3224 domain-containing protein [Anaerolineales bacterium]|nr:DUF3224 domain-containing protein [Anaerolineales bacterium]
MKAKGQFEVDLKPLPLHAQAGHGVTFGRMSIDKTFAGDLTATSTGEMLSVMAPVEGAAGYVAIEQVSGRLLDRAGTFVLQHFGVMAQAENRLILEVVPASGTGELEGLAGSMVIQIQDGAHFYEFDFHLAGGSGASD